MPVASHVTPASFAWSIRASWSITGTGVPAIYRRARIDHNKRTRSPPGVTPAAAVTCETGRRGLDGQPTGRLDGGRVVVLCPRRSDVTRVSQRHGDPARYERVDTGAMTESLLAEVRQLRADVARLHAA